ncbi:hypothetical protein [Georgenia sp. SYP-B2076]|uniref:hypothetical protein n=1 Tax=Georgenia sp. SYP-B2076 TaxID=2495881 RepID=UPI000F8DC12C|nr:hypothetical protein [Georgenia sp. SYP-B2076]
MSEHEIDPHKTDKPGAADLTFGGADTETDRDDELSPSPAVHGDEGGGDLAAGAEEDSASKRPRQGI